MDNLFVSFASASNWLIQWALVLFQIVVKLIIFYQLLTWCRKIEIDALPSSVTKPNPKDATQQKETYIQAKVYYFKFIIY